RSNEFGITSGIDVLTAGTMAVFTFETRVRARQEAVDELMAHQTGIPADPFRRLILTLYGGQSTHEAQAYQHKRAHWRSVSQ
ncbi:MAG: hypothetical protein P8Y94_09880, partial [Acidobacteriota bacterium]